MIESVSEYLVKIKELNGAYEAPRLAGSTPIFPKNFKKGIFENLPLTLVESRKHKSFSRIKARLKSISSCQSVLLTPGASQGFFLVALNFMSSKKKWVMERPYYEPYYKLLLALGAEVEFWDRPVSESETSMALKKLKRMATKNKILVLSSPHFFFGLRLPDSELKELGAIFANVIVDEVFFGQFSSDSNLSSGDLGPAVVKINGISKSLGLSNVRFGWLAGEGKLIRSIEEVSLFLNVDMPTFSIQVAERALRLQSKIRRSIGLAAAKNRKIILQFIRRRPNVLSHDFETGLFGSVDLSKIIGTDHLREIRASGLSSELFGVSGHVRIRIDGSTQYLKRILRAIE
jgi:aspartate/methionine/tyrosine aminotransferase